MNDPLTSSLPAALATEGHYSLRLVDGSLGIYLDYSEVPGEMRSMLVRDGISHAEDFSTHVDDLQEESRIMAHDFMTYEMPYYEAKGL